jgi:hypothetical protein
VLPLEEAQGEAVDRAGRDVRVGWCVEQRRLSCWFCRGCRRARGGVCCDVTTPVEIGGRGEGGRGGEGEVAQGGESAAGTVGGQVVLAHVHLLAHRVAVICSLLALGWTLRPAVLVTVAVAVLLVCSACRGPVHGLVLGFGQRGPPPGRRRKGAPPSRAQLIGACDGQFAGDPGFPVLVHGLPSGRPSAANVP